MKKILFAALVLTFSILACNIQAPTTPTQPPVVTEPPVIVTEPPVPTAPPVIPNTTCNQLSLFLDPSLASGYSCETIPENAEMMEIHPEYTQLTLDGYLLADKFFSATISLYPLQRYSELMPDFIPGRISALQNLVAGGLPDNFGLPFLPAFNAGQVFSTQYQVISFASGSGIRYLTLYAQYAAPINNHDLFYTFQGISQDGKYWVTAILPINHPLLPANGDNPPGGLSWEEFANNYEVYITDINGQLSSQAAESFLPSILVLDALVESITIGE